ncbi:hypothetical protein MUP06_01260 [Patescibacteria group bacterium]|nr:hypothetical protein [Patescibacteria group bacterium]
MEEVTRKEEKKEKGKDLMAILSYIGILFLVPLLASKDNAFAKFHARQGLVLFIAEIATYLVAWIPFIGWFIGMTAWVIWLVLSIIGIINVVNGKQVPLPVIGKFAEKFKF